VDDTAVPCHACLDAWLAGWLAGAHLLIETSLPAGLTGAASAAAAVGGSRVLVCSNDGPGRPSPASTVEAFDPAAKSSGDHELVGYIVYVSIGSKQASILIHHDEEMRKQ